MACTSIARPPAPAKPGGELQQIHVEGVGIPPRVLADVAEAARAARAPLLRWGGLLRPVLVVVHPSHADLERLVGRGTLPWLRAWAQYDRVDLQSPETFGHRDYRPALRELLSHELCHVLMYQRVGTAATWTQVWVPFWFREGMASWTSEQGYRRGTLRSLGLRLAALDPPVDPLLDGEALTRRDQPLAYGAAHWAFDRVLVEAGEPAVLAILDDLRRASRCQPAASADPTSAPAEAATDCSGAGMSFGAAFERHVGSPEAHFARRFRLDLLTAAAPES